MTHVERFEDLEVWQRSRTLTQRVYDCTRHGEFAKDFSLKDQIRRSVVSVMSNIAEGFERGGNREFLQFLAISKGSCGELRAQLYAALDQRYLSQEVFGDMLQEALETSRMLSRLMAYLRRSTMRGVKYAQQSKRGQEPQ